MVDGWMVRWLNGWMVKWLDGFNQANQIAIDYLFKHTTI
jgi:hypothetical protein